MMVVYAHYSSGGITREDAGKTEKGKRCWCGGGSGGGGGGDGGQDDGCAVWSESRKKRAAAG